MARPPWSHWLGGAEGFPGSTQLVIAAVGLGVVLRLTSLAIFADASPGPLSAVFHEEFSGADFARQVGSVGVPYLPDQATVAHQVPVWAQMDPGYALIADFFGPSDFVGYMYVSAYGYILDQDG